MRKRRFLAAIAFLALSPAWAAEDQFSQTLTQYCGKRSSGSLSSNSGQIQRLCDAAVMNERAAIINGNNSRVWTPVAAVCMNTCGTSLAGADSTSVCRAGVVSPDAPVVGNDSCDSTVRAAWYAYQTNHASIETESSSSDNLQGVFELMGSDAPALLAPSAKARLSEKDGDARAGGISLPESCRVANETGNAQARINCAIETDPNIPAFVRDPKFAAEVQQVTGQSLESIMNGNGESLMANVAPAMLNHMSHQLASPSAFAGFMRLGVSMTSRFMNHMAKEDADWFASRLPSPFSSLAGRNSTSTSQSIIASVNPGTSAASSGLSGGDLRDETGQSLARSPASEREPEELTIFQIISRRYAQVLNRVE